MQKNWYVVYTRPHYEKKVAQILSKKKIQNFCPVSTKKIKSLLRTKFVLEPLFQSYVFVEITDGQINVLRQTEGVINFLYWNNSLAVINPEEIEIIKSFINRFQIIELEKAKVNPSNSVSFIDEPTYSLVGNLLTLRHKTLKIYLPSLGFTMIGKDEHEDYFIRETILSQQKSLLRR